ncbi:P-loop NTPase fold protein [Gloeobacter kilaueensis]|uniref:Uncharacterized protein n=1 Tax=Gloeobacter kilaueensis (strain ATCC BAA-2537 / CCAP 1431/1 / ULC 316 / JS1) TaxID=1183438 RepID=U5QBY3_GLOK1|nr:P-loop NTPase fold protein [Gloeobacter kilaueensis]AGY56318.1 hypothetical protein GKIL_0071 [Gloeobacter kilaueensis JS1]
MPLEHLFADEVPDARPYDHRRTLYEKFGIVSNPFPSANQTSGHPHLSTPADKQIDSEVIAFYSDRRSHVIAVTATQGIGKTNLLNAYETALREKLAPKGFFVIRYIADPEPSFDPLIRSIFENLGEEHLARTVTELRKKIQLDSKRQDVIEQVKVPEVKIMVRSLIGADTDDKLQRRCSLAYQWLIGLPVRKAHRDEISVQFRLDTVESRTRALQDIVYFSAAVGTLEGIFLLLDELEKQGSTLSIMNTVRYLSALRALIDALPRYLFLMLALTPDALERYKEQVPALRGRLINEVSLPALTTEEQAIDLWRFYLNSAEIEAKSLADDNQWRRIPSADFIVSKLDAQRLFGDLLRRGSVRGANSVRQREYLHALHESARRSIELAV